MRSMQENFDLLYSRIKEGTQSVSLECLNKTLEHIKEPTICIGTGGSYAPAIYAEKILNKKHNILARAMEPRGVLYTDLKYYDNLVALSYGNKNAGINQALKHANDSELRTYILTSSENKGYAENLIRFRQNDEKSFISIAGTLIPMGVLLKYYLENDVYLERLISCIFDNESTYEINDNPIYEILYGVDSKVATNILESTMVESGIAIPILSEKYSYCHGRSTTAHHHPINLIYLINGEPNELDKVLLGEAQSSYENILLLESDYQDSILGEYDLSVKALELCRQIALKHNKDLTKVDYNPAVKRLYKFDGKM